MDPERWRKIEALYHAARGLKPRRHGADGKHGLCEYTQTHMVYIQRT